MPSSKYSTFLAVYTGALTFLLAAIPASVSSSDSAPQTFSVRHREGVVHGFLVLRSLANEVLANGELVQNDLGDRVVSHLFFHFKDGSINDETTVFSQRHTFRLISDHLIQKGPSFKHALDVMIDAAKSEVTVHATDEHGKEEVKSEHIDVPPDIANGMAIVLLKNLAPHTQHVTLHYLATTPKPRMVKLEVNSQGEDIFGIGEGTHKITHYVAKVEIGGIAGVVAPIVGKQPADTNIWILGGNAPAWIKSEGPLSEEGAIWRVELVSPVGPKEAAKSESKSPENKKPEDNKPEDKKPENRNSEIKTEEPKKPEPKP